MDGYSISQHTASLDVSSVAGRITSLIARRHGQAVLAGDDATAQRFDVSLDTIYFASLLLMLVNGTGQTRGREQVLAALDSVEDVVADLRHWIENNVGSEEGMF
jgi:hypothetical protein